MYEKPFKQSKAFICSLYTRMLETGLLRESTIKSQERMHKPIVFHDILSRSLSMKKLFESIKKAAQTDVSIYISGETGVGKELVARAIHAESSRSNQPFVAVNVANFSNDLIESQLFGQKKERQSDYEVMIMIRPSTLRK